MSEDLTRERLKEEYEHPEQWVQIGAVCQKAGGHLAFFGEHDFGACGSHYSADIFIAPKRGYRHPDYTEFEESAGAMRNELEELEWKVQGRDPDSGPVTFENVDAMAAALHMSETGDSWDDVDETTKIAQRAVVRAMLTAGGIDTAATYDEHSI